MIKDYRQHSLQDKLLANYTPEGWEDFVSQFDPGDLMSVAVPWEMLGAVIHYLQVVLGKLYPRVVFISMRTSEDALVTLSKLPAEYHMEFSVGLISYARAVKPRVREAWEELAAKFDPKNIG